MMNNSRDGMKYFMPLTQGRPKDGPSTSVFSVPKVQYSKETEALVKNLMRESRLSFTQKHVFETILRDGKSLPEHPTQLMGSHQRLKKYMQQCHRDKARHMGVPLIESEIQRMRRPQYRAANASGSGKRTLDVIQASGDLQPVLPPRACIPSSKEAEKDRLAHKMAYGTDKINDKTEKPKLDKFPTGKVESVDDIQKMRFEELIDEVQDRMQFLLTMEKEKRDKDYRPCILNQINEKLQEMRKISPSGEKSVRESLFELHLLDKRYSSTFTSDNSPSIFFW